MSTARLMQMAAAGVDAGSDSIFGPSYGNWDGSLLRFSSTSDANGGSNSSLNGLAFFYDPVTSRVYDGYAGGSYMSYHTGGYYLWNSGNSIMPNRPSSSNADSGNATSGATIVYQDDKSYVLFGSIASRTVYVWLNGTTPVYKGYFNLQTNHNARSLAFGEWDGGTKLFSNSISQTTYYYTIPDLENLNNSTISVDGNFTTGVSAFYSMSYAGKDSNDDVHFYFRNSGKMYLYKIADGASSATAATEVENWTRSGGGSYGHFIDYDNKKLYTGGFGAQTLYRYPLVEKGKTKIYVFFF